MEQEQIDYSVVMELGFKEDFEYDVVFEAQYGYPYSIVTYDLTKKIHIDWNKVTRLCEVVRIDNKKGMNIKARMPIYTLRQLEMLIAFFADPSKCPF